MSADEEDDYMSMVFEEPKKLETSAARVARERKERQRRALEQKTPAARAAEKTEAALAAPLDSSNKGFKLLSKLGYKPGQALGKSEGARLEPIGISVKENRGGIGLDAENKKRLREEAERETKRVKVKETDYRDQVRLEREEARHEAQFRSAQKVAETLDSDSDKKADQSDLSKKNADIDAKHRVPLKSVNILWRGLLRHRLEREQERKIRRGLDQRLPTFEDVEEDVDDRIALNKDAYEEEIEEQDAELEEFSALPAATRLDKVVHYLRETHCYCFWCKFKYPDSSMEGCPGITEEDHD